MTLPRELSLTGVSTTYEWKKTKVNPAPAGNQRSEGTPSSRGLRARDRYHTNKLAIRYRGGAESKWTIWVAGQVWVVPGHATIDDLMGALFREGVPWQK